MLKQLFLFIVSISVGIVLVGCTDSAGGEIDAAVTNGPQTTTQEDSVSAESAEPTLDTSESTTDELGTISNTLIQLSDPLDEPEYYCIDVPGFRQSLDLEGALMAHTCKPNADDELFSINYPAEGQLYMPAYELCMAAGAAETGAELFLTACGDSPLQRFTQQDDETIQLQSSDSAAFCLTVADQDGEPTGGPSHLRRDLILQPCTDSSPALSQWAFPGPAVP